MNDEKIYMGKISYINASPVFYGLDHGLSPPWLKMVTDVPSVLNDKIKTGLIKISPISAAFYAMNHKDLLLLPDLSISCNGRVLSVILASNHPIDDLEGKKVILSRDSVSAATFLKMIFNRKKVCPVYEIGDTNNFSMACNAGDAVLVIGDAALKHPWDQKFEHCIDLGQLWYEMTQLPFVFAVWVVRRAFAGRHPLIVKKIHQLILESRQKGEQNIDTIIETGENRLNLDHSIIKEYFDLLYCDLDHRKIRAMQLFFDSLYDQGILNKKVHMEFFKP